MKNREKIIIIALLILFIFLAIFIFAKINGNKKEKKVENEQNIEIQEDTEEYVEILSDGTKLNTSEALSKEKKVNDLEFANIELTNSNGQSVLLADVKNTGSVATELTLVDVVILDEEGNTIGKVGGIIAPLEPGETTQFNTSMTIDYTNAYDFEIIVK